MKMRPILQLMLFLVLLAGSSEEFFFEYPKKALTEFFQSLKAKKQPPKTNIEHYHVHYYPIPLSMFAWMKAPEKRDLDKLYDDTIRSFGWMDYRYKYIPEPSLIISSNLPHLWGEDESWDPEILDFDDIPSIDRNSKGILVQVPVSQHIILQMLKKSRKEKT